MSIPGTEGYAAEADELAVRYESFGFAETHTGILELLPPAPSRVLDIGAGTGRDAAGFASLGYQVLAVEPTAAMRGHGQRLHPHPAIDWLDDSLPDLARVLARGEIFDIVMLTAVWMHLDAVARTRAMPVVARLLRPGGVMAMSLRHGPVPPGRRMFDVSTDETIALAGTHGLVPLLVQNNRRGPLQLADVTWSRLALRTSGDAA
ncbi:class I SAM-dependent methyltransferase [Dongia sp.]|uniref:class I SAM-dependent methyltransferase n=1 Tax=Dongia sp. TaxID=1977262 RepID=UPI0034A1A28B